MEPECSGNKTDGFPLQNWMAMDWNRNGKIVSNLRFSTVECKQESTVLTPEKALLKFFVLAQNVMLISFYKKN